MNERKGERRMNERKGERRMNERKGERRMNERKGERLGGREGGTDRKREGEEEDRMRGEVMVERESNLRTPQVVSAPLSSPPHCACRQYQTKKSTYMTHYLCSSSTPFHQ